MFAFSAEELALLALPGSEGKVCVEIGITTPLRYCTGTDPTQVGSDWYEPRGMKLKEIMISSPDNSSTSIELDNSDEVISVQNGLERFSGNTITYHLFLRHETFDWTPIGDSIEWECSSCAWDPLKFEINMGADIGNVPRAGLEVGSPRCGLIVGDSRCKLAGTNICGGTRDECDAFGNLVNFRGFDRAPKDGFVVKGRFGAGWVRFQSTNYRRTEPAGGGADEGGSGGSGGPRNPSGRVVADGFLNQFIEQVSYS